MKVASLVPHRPPTVLTVHNLVGGTQPRPLREVLQRFERGVVRDTDHLIVISDEIREHFADVVPADRTTFVLPASPRRTVGRDAADVRASYGIDVDAPLVVVVARHHRQKNLRMFLDAFAAVRRSIPAARALLVGDGPETDALQRHAATLGLGASVVFAGRRPNPADEMHAADVVALSSDWEGSPLVVAECLQLARPLVCTAVGTATANLVDGRDARITPVGDAAAFAAALVEVLDDPTLAASLATNGARVAEARFDPARLVAEVVAVYERVSSR
jgi:glycosyltransferase involved in cell wall biosynthesis